MKKIGFIGAGHMAEAMIRGFIEANKTQKNAIYVTNNKNEARLNYLTKTYGVVCSDCITTVVKNCQLLIIAVKPKDASTVFSQMKKALTADTCIISIMAGVSLKTMSHYLGEKRKLVRVMPNTAVAIRLSATGLCRFNTVSDDEMNEVMNLFKAVGTVVEVAEDELNIVTAISGSGPAYFYYIVDAMIQEAKSLGFNEDVARSLITQTLLGSAHMLKETTLSAKQLCEQVTSKNGTTERALKTFTNENLTDTIGRAVRQAYKRAVELSKTYE